ncbi:MAG: glycoside hydrolase family 3 C-terminal domain-containing protein [Cyclobacteriaceae bacterium]|nr:glycoside hydrolase family 3 C-terminal domain-containing protein [Cyclobacteriaceae bacterium]
MLNNRNIQFVILAITILGLSSCKPQSGEKNEDKFALTPLNYAHKISAKIDSLLTLMTLEEKLGQLSQLNNAGDKHIDSVTINAIRKGEVGSLLINRRNFYSIEERNFYQKLAVEESRLGIPIIFGHDVIHGFRTIFPTSLAQSCTWSPDLVEKGAEVAAREAAAQGVDWAFAPMVDVARDPRWGRIAEGYGEDSYLNAIFGAAVVQGYQGADMSATDRVAACMKHYVGYGAAVGGRGKQFTDISKRTLHEVYLPPFKAGVEQGALTVMTAFNDINGTPATAYTYGIREVLKKEYGFKGFVVSDWDAVKHLLWHGIAADTTDAAQLALNAGVDMEMKTIFYKKLKEALAEGTVAIETIDDAVRRILYVKYKLGLFNRPYVKKDNTKELFLSAAHRKEAREMAAASMVLLQNNNNVLPVTATTKSIAVVGAFANERDVMGWWKSTGKFEDVITAFDGIKSNASNKVAVTDKIMADTDIIIACLGEPSHYFGESRHRADITIPAEQVEFLKSLQKHNKPIVLVVFNGRPLDLSNVTELAQSILIAWHPGSETGNALADVLFGYHNPYAKLTASFPRSVGQVPVYYSRRNSGNPNGNKYVDLSGEPLFPFGFGLSYTTFEYSALEIEKNKIPVNGTLKLSAIITNTGDKDGYEVVQLYVRDLVGSTTRPVKELKGFQKIRLKSGESKRVSFTLSTKELAVLNKNFEPVIEPGGFHVWIASNSTEGLQGEFEIVE